VMPYLTGRRRWSASPRRRESLAKECPLARKPVDVCRNECGGKCCRYINLRIDPPTRRIDREEIRWFPCHEGVKVSFEEGKWWLQVEPPCKNLTEDNLCAIYETRPDVCSDYGMGSCDHLGEQFEHPEFTEPEQWEAWLAAKRHRRNKLRRRRKKQTEATSKTRTSKPTPRKRRAKS